MASTYPLAVPTNIILSNVAAFDMYMRKAASYSSQFDGLVSRISFVMGLMTEHYCVETASKVKRVKDAIRAHQKGTRVLESEELDIGELVDNLPNNPSAVDVQICHRLFRKMAARLHPDRGGKHEEFTRLERAYKRKDVKTLQYMHDSIFLHHHPGWRSSNVAYAIGHMQRMQIRLDALKTRPEFYMILAFNKSDLQQAISLGEKILQSKLDQVRVELANILASQNEKSK